MKKPPLVRKNSNPQILALLDELGKRPAMNGGFQDLVRKQDDQTAELRDQTAKLDALERRLAPVEAFTAKWDKRWIWLAGAVGTITISVLGRFVAELLGRIQVVLH